MKDYELEGFLNEQLRKWELARNNFEALKELETKKLDVDGVEFAVLYNPAREVSSAAKTDPKSIASRPCFLCSANRPDRQDAYPILPGYSLLVNPFPIFDKHFTIASDTHQPQSILTSESTGSSRLATMFWLARQMKGYTVFYNGPKCGASAPDHLHYQAVPSEKLPLVGKDNPFPYRSLSVMTANIEEFVAEMTAHIQQLMKLPENKGDDEPMVNLFVQSKEGDEVFGLIIPRRAHRPACYGSEENQMLISPGAIDVGGAIVCCRRCDYDAMDSAALRRILEETTVIP